MPNSSSSAFTPCHPAMARWRCRSLATSIFPMVMLARFRTSQMDVVVDFDTPAGHAAWTTVPGRDFTVKTRDAPAGDHGMSQHR